ncbi:Uncharacterised protein [Yersinia aldovae]|nr:Uncharacterised protein [Yersinia aldovae]
MFRSSNSSSLSMYNEIINLIKPYSTLIHIKKNQLIPIRTNKIILPSNGRLEIWVSGKTLGYIGCYFPLGLFENNHPDNKLCASIRYRAMADLLVLEVSTGRWWEELSKYPELLRGLSELQSRLILMLLGAYCDMTQSSQYKIIRKLIYRYEFLISEGLLSNKQSINEFISSRRHGGKSYIFKVLKELSQGGFIIYGRGCKFKIKKELPEDW